MGKRTYEDMGIKMKIEKAKSWDDLKANADRLTDLIEGRLEKEPPKRIADVLKAVNQVDSNCSALPNPNQKGHYCQLMIYPSVKWETWPQISMDISKYDLYN